MHRACALRCTLSLSRQRLASAHSGILHGTCTCGGQLSSSITRVWQRLAVLTAVLMTTVTVAPSMMTIWRGCGRSA